MEEVKGQHGKQQEVRITIPLKETDKTTTLHLLFSDLLSIQNREYLQLFIKNVEESKTQFSIFPMTNLHMKKQSRFKNTLVLDIDETLVRCLTAVAFKNQYQTDDLKKPDLSFTLQDNEKQFNFILILRPFLIDFLKLMANNFEIVIYSLGVQDYVNKIISLIDPYGHYISFILDRRYNLYDQQ